MTNGTLTAGPPVSGGPMAIAGLPLDAPSTWAIVGSACGLAAAIDPLPEPVKALLLLAFVLLGPGGALLHHFAKELPVVAVRALTPITGIAVVMIVVSGGLYLEVWSPRPTLVLLAAAGLAAGLANRAVFPVAAGASAPLEVDRPGPPCSPAEGTRRRNVATALVVVTTAAFLIALPGLDAASSSQYGLLASGPRLFVTSIVLSVMAFAYCIRARLLGLAVVALVLQVLIQRLPSLVSTEVALYSWTYKHIGVVDYIQDHGRLAHGIDVYQGWPGLFASTAWFSDLTGVPPETLAHWFTVVFHLGLVGITYALARTWGLAQRASLVATFLVAAMNWVAQDYYSPQATALVLAVGFLILIGRSRQAVAAAPLAILLFTALALSHQLTPYWLILFVLVLTVTKRLPLWLLAVMMVITGMFLAFNYDTVSDFNFLSLNPFANAQSNIPTTGIHGQRVTRVIIRSGSGFLWVSAAFCALLQRRRGVEVLAPGTLAFSSFLLLAGASYGGEAIFRVFLYSLFGCAVLIAPVVTRLLDTTPRKATLACVVSVAAVLTSAQGYYGGWFANLMSTSQVRESKELLADAEVPSFITPAAPVWPERASGRYVDHVASTALKSDTFDFPMVFSAELTGSHFKTVEEYNTFVAVAGRRNAPTYLIITDQMQVYAWYFGILPMDALPNLERWLRSDNRWTVYDEADDYVIFKSTPAVIGAT